jgi:hypothetical protein
LLDKGAIKADDELCSGNGYWFYVREKKLIEKYIRGDEVQGFNPVSEADTVLCKEKVEDEVLLPSDQDLDYPEIDDKDQELAKWESEIKIPSEDDLGYPDGDLEMNSEATSAEKKKVVPRNLKTTKKNDSVPKAKPVNRKMKTTTTVKAQKPFMNQNLLYVLATVFFILALIAFYYRRRIVKEIIEANIIFPPAYAQIIPETVKKKIQYLIPVTFDGQKLYPYRSLQGLNLIADSLEIPDKCEKINRISFKLMTLFYEDFTKEHKTRISNCLLRDNPELQTVDYQGISYPLDQENFKRFKETQNALSSQRDIFSIFIKEDYRLRVKNGAITSEERNRIYKINEKLSKSSSLLARLMQISIYMDLNYQGQIEAIIKSIIEKEYTTDLLLTSGFIKDQKNLQKKFKSLLQRVKQNFDDKKLLNVLGAYLALDIEPNLREIIIDELEIPLKQSHVLEIIKSHNYGLQFPFVWTPWIEKFSSTHELEKYLNKLEFEKYLNAGKYHYLGLLRSYFPIEKQKRDAILSAYLSLEKSSNPELQDLKFRLMLNDDLQKYRMKEKKISGTNFLEARKFYRAQMMKNDGIPYALYQLLLLGDVQEEYFVKMLALKTYGL